MLFVLKIPQSSSGDTGRDGTLQSWGYYPVARAVVAVDETVRLCLGLSLQNSTVDDEDRQGVKIICSIKNKRWFANKLQFGVCSSWNVDGLECYWDGAGRKI